MLSQKERLRLSQISELLYKISKKVRILRHLAWPSSVRYEFFRLRSEKLPEVTLHLILKN